MRDFFNVLMVISGILMIIFILIQQRGAGLGAAFGGTNELHTTRRGVEKIVFQITVILAVIFVLSAFLGLLSS